MKRVIAAFALLLVVASILPLFGATGIAHRTIQVVSSTGTVLDGTASAVSGVASETVNIVDHTGHIIDSFGGGGSGTVNSGTGPAIAQYPAGTGTTVGPATVSGDATIAQGGAFTLANASSTRTHLGITIPWAGGSSATVSTSAANAFPAMGIGLGSAATTEGQVMELAPLGTFSGLNCETLNAAGAITLTAAGTYTIAFRKNGLNGNQTCVLDSTHSTCSDGINTDTTALNDRVDLVDTPATTPTALVIKCTMSFAY